MSSEQVHLVQRAAGATRQAEEFLTEQRVTRVGPRAALSRYGVMSSRRMIPTSRSITCRSHTVESACGGSTPPNLLTADDAPARTLLCLRVVG